MKTPDHIKEILSRLPKKPGVYQFFDKEGVLLYVGKAKKLKHRVSSYFNKETFENNKTRVLVKQIDNVKFIVVETEYDALFLENSLIKKHQPRYNVMLRDDKTYPWICIKKERFPRVFATRRVIKDGSEYFGPYGSVKIMNTMLDFVRKIYKLRTCKYDLSEENIKAEKYRVCLEYHINNCLGPCVAKQSEQDYNESIDAIRGILKGNVRMVIEAMRKEMTQAAEEMKFELAQEFKEKLDLLENFQAKSTIVNPSINDVDVFSIYGDASYSYVNFLKINNGSIVQSHTLEIKQKISESAEEMLATAIVEIRERFNSTSKTIYTNLPLTYDIADATLLHPQRGDKKKIVDLSVRNARYFMLDRLKMQEKTDPERHSNRIMEQLKEDLHLSELPRHIECFDNSNFQGSYPVAACVVFKNGKPSKKDYRHFNIKTVEGPDDFASMREVIERRYTRLKKEGESLPQLLIVDGGKGQLSSAVETLKDIGMYGEMAVIGIAKRLEEIYFPYDPLPLYIDKKSESLKLIQRLRNEAHRFGITHHRNKRSKGSIGSVLNVVPGIGPKTEEKLLKKFRSVKRIKEASDEALLEILNTKQLKEIRERL